jgi:hypothetical protein
MNFITNFRNTDLGLYQRAITIHDKFRFSINPKAVTESGEIKAAYSSMWSETHLISEIEEFWKTIRTLRLHRDHMSVEKSSLKSPQYA